MQWPFIITCICLLASVGSKAVADEALVLHYTFDTDTGERAKDRSSYGNDGKIVKGQYLTEYNGRRGVLRLDGEKSVLNCPDSDSLFWSGDISFEAWVRLNGPVTGRGLASLLEANYFHFSVVTWYQMMAGFGTVDPEHGRETFLVPVTRSILSDKWAHIAMVVEYPRWRYYRNGELVRDAYMPIPLLPSRRSAKQIGVTSPIDLDEVRLYRRALTPAEIAAHAQDEQVPPSQEDELAVEPHWYEDAVALRLSCKGSNYAGYTAQMTLLNGDGTKAVAPASTPLKEAFEGSGRFVGTVRFPLSSLEGKSLDGVARILAPDGKLVNKVYRHASLKKPDWVHTREGHSDEVMPPWTPVEAQTKPDGAVEVRVWGRRHTFGTTLFPRQIETRGKEILAAPIALGGRVDGKPIAWKEGRVNLTDATKTEASLEQTCADDPLTLRINTSVAYDGYMIFDCEVKARRDLSLEELTLEIPLRSRHATLFYDGRRSLKDDSVRHGDAVRGDMAFRFSPNIWLGDEELGLCWQAESDQDWRYADEQKAIEILPRGQTTIFQANLVNVPTQLAAGQTLHYKFALQATPIKPLLRDAWDLRIARNEPFGRPLDLPDWKTDGKPMLQYYAEAGVRHLAINLCDLWSYPMPIHKKFADALHRLMDKAHVYGLKVYAYSIHQRFPVSAPEFDVHGLHMSKRPLEHYVPESTPAVNPRPGPITHKYGGDSQGTAMFCAKSEALQDANVHSLAKLLDEYGVDGVYLDGTSAHTTWCQNMLHGCGYRTKDGSIRQTSPVFAKRQFIKRIYTAVKQRRPDGVVDLHCSFGYTPAVVAYSDMMWTGEQWGHLKEGPPDGYVSGTLTLDMFRTQYTGYQLGVPAEVLAYRILRGSAAKEKEGMRKLSATTLLHDIPIRPSTPGFALLAPRADRQKVVAGQRIEEDCFDLMVKLWKMRDQFGAKEAQKLFYWNNQDYVRVSPENCYALLFKHPKNGVLAFVSNLSKDAQTVTVQFNLDKLGLRGRKLDVFAPLTDEPVAMTAEGSVSVPLQSEDWIYVWLRPSASK